VGYWHSEDDDTPVHEAQNRLTDMLISRIAVGKGQRVLDAGSGSGGPACRLAQETGCSVLGITVSRRQVEQGKQLAASKGLDGRVQFQYANAMDLPFENASFDAVWACESLFYMDRPQALSEFYRVMRPAGYLVIADLTTRLIDPETVPQLTKEEQVALARAFGAAATSSLLPKQYPDLVRDAGFVVEEFRELTQHQAATMERSTPIYEKRHDDIRQALGEEEIKFMDVGWYALAKTYRHTVGYILIVGRKL
jgi:ubiquinone/menaquinone biosynthesis C-methylase UbiE